MIILVVLFLLTLAEHFYSLYRKDGFCSWENTAVNIATQMCGLVKDFAMPALSVIGIVLAVNRALPHLFAIPAGAISLVACLLLLDLLYYLFHRTSHAFALPWMFHFVHHSGDKFNLSAGFRSSFFEILTLFCFYSFALILGFPLATFLLAFKITSTYQFLTHSRYLKLPRIAEWVLVTPGYHLIHHDQDIKNQNSNFGGVFSFWDKIFGTYVAAAPGFTPGLKNYKQNGLIRIQLDPVLKIGPRLLRVH